MITLTEQKDMLKGEVKVETPKKNLPFKEKIYEKIKIPLPALDALIVVIAVAIVACIIIGAMKGNGVM